jgi:hypothetical protein
MNTTLKALAAAAALVATAGAQATILFVDNFDLPTAAPVTIQDFTANGTAVWQAAPGTTLTAPNLATSRLIGADLATKPFSTSNMSVSAGGLDGTLAAQASNGATGKALVQWTIPSVPLPTLVGNQYFFSILTSTTGISGATTVKFSFDGAGANDFTLNSAFGNIVNFAGAPVTFALDNTQSSYLVGGGTLTLEFHLNEASSFTIDQFAIQVPEPSSLALAGLALLGAGFAASRRKTK